jgi:hypothetical protein
MIGDHAVVVRYHGHVLGPVFHNLVNQVIYLSLVLGLDQFFYRLRRRGCLVLLVDPALQNRTEIVDILLFDQLYLAIKVIQVFPLKTPAQGLGIIFLARRYLFHEIHIFLSNSLGLPVLPFKIRNIRQQQ